MLVFSPLSWAIADWFMEGWSIPSDCTLGGRGGIWFPVWRQRRKHHLRKIDKDKTLTINTQKNLKTTFPHQPHLLTVTRHYFFFFFKYYLGGLFKSLLVFLQIEQWRTYRKRVGRERAGEGPSKDPSRNRTCVGRAAAKCCTVSATVGLGHYLSRPTCSIDSIGQLQ